MTLEGVLKTLVVYPHGLGDCILATPALRNLKRSTGEFIGIAILERFRSSEFFAHCPYVDEVLYTKDAWNEFPSFDEGMAFVEAQCKQYVHERSYDRLIVVRHSDRGSKILDTASALAVKLADYHTEVFIGDEDRAHAQEIIGGWDHYGFAHSRTGFPPKDFPDGFAASWLQHHHGLAHVHDPGLSFDNTRYSINVGFELMRRASAVCLTDSAFYHACAALRKRVDLAYFERGPRVYSRVRPLHNIDENIVYSLEGLL